MATDNGELKQHASSSAHDYYELLGVSPVSSEAELRRAYRKTALKYHPDKVGADQEKLDKFHLLQIAYDVLSDPAIRELYDNARRAREAKKERKAAYSGRRKQFIDDLEAREAAAESLKRKRDPEGAEAEFEQKLARLAADGRRRREARVEALRKEAQEEQERAAAQAESALPTNGGSQQLEDADRAVRIRFTRSAETEHLTTEKVTQLFERFGKIQDVILRDKKAKVEGHKHRQPVCTGMIVFNSIVGAHAAVSDMPKLRDQDTDYAPFDPVEWFNGQEPAHVPKPKLSAAPTPTFTPTGTVAAEAKTSANGRKVPTFSFKGGKSGAAPSMDEVTMMRLKNAEKRRLEEKIRKEEAENENE